VSILYNHNRQLNLAVYLRLDTYTVWILAIRAQLTRRALSKILSLDLVSIGLANYDCNKHYPVQPGCAPRILSQMALCSKAKRVCNNSIPVHQLSEKPVLGFPAASRGRKLSSAPLVSRSSLPSSCWSLSS
jgi:hypothetical protein